ncbi:MAG TPA: LysR substrate-binding domain-containing protein [Planktothrix sp.]|jgi:LysR family cyn operon transcriptional activator
MELRHLRYFIKAAELLHFTRAAESLYISQPTLSVHIQQLEEELGTPLFARVGRNVRLTQAGQLFLCRALRAVHELETAGIEIDAIKGLLRGKLCVAALPLYGRMLMPKWISEFNSLHPNVHIHARAGSSDDIETGIISGAIDLGISMLPAEHSEINVTDLFVDEIMLVISTKHPLANVKVLQQSDLVGLPLALPSQKISASRVIGKYFESQNIDPLIAVEHDDGHSLLELIKLGQFVTALPKRALPPDPEFVTKSLPGGGLTCGLGALWTNLSPASKAFLDIALNSVQVGAAI